MREKFVRLIFAIFALIFLSFQATAQVGEAGAFQSVFPVTVYVGDSVEVRYSFHSELNLMGTATKKNRIELSADYPVFLSQKDKFTVVNAYIENDGNEYTFLMNIVPWVRGRVSFPYFDLCSLIAYSSEENKSDAYFYMELSPIDVLSIAEKNGAHSFLPPSPPLLIPGTAFLIAVLSVVFLFLFGTLIVAIANIPSIRTKVSELLFLYSMRRVSRKTVKKLMKLKKASQKITNDSDFALSLQKIFREYLTNHFLENFKSLTSAEIYGKVSDIFNGEIPSSLEYASEFFVRTDFVRFAGGAFLSGERDETVERLIKIVGEDL